MRGCLLGGLGGGGTGVAETAEHDFRGPDREALPLRGRHLHAGEVGQQISHLPAFGAHEVMVAVEVRIEQAGTGTEVEMLDIAQGGQVVKRLLDGPNRYGWL